MEHTAGLAKPVKWPEVTEWGQLFKSFTTDKEKAPPDVILGKGWNGRRDGRVSPYIWMPRGVKSGYVALRGDPLSTLKEMCLSDLTISFRAVSHAETGYTLITAEYSEIIGGHWLAYVKTDTLPHA